jgi:hypothetical protein
MTTKTWSILLDAKSTSKPVKDTGRALGVPALCALVGANILGGHFRIQVIGHMGMRGNDRFAF